MKGAVAIAAVLACAFPSSAGAPGEAAAVPVFTNADLERMFGPPSGPEAPVEPGIPDDWAFVGEFLDRQWARLDAERALDLAARGAEAGDRPEPRRRWIAPYCGVYGASWGALPYRYPGSHPQLRPARHGPPHARPEESGARPERGTRGRLSSGRRPSSTSSR